MAVAPDVFEVAGEELVGAGVFARVDGLGEVDHDRLVFPIENVEGREVAVDAVVGEEELDVVENFGVHVIGLRRCEAESAQLRSRGLVVADVLHEDGGAAVALGDGAGDVGADVVEVVEGVPFIMGPGAQLHVAAKVGFVGQGAAEAAAAHLFANVIAFAVAIALVIFEAAVLEGFVDFGGEEASAEIGMGAATADGGFFATLEDLNDFGDEIAVDEILERFGQEVVL